MDKIKFARMINLLSRWGMRELDQHEMLELAKLTTIEPTNIPMQRTTVSEEDVNILIMHMNSKTSKIEAIKAYRQITNAGLKEAKDAVERYW